jgi:hypothetical protein
MSKFCRIDSATLFTQTVNSAPVLTVVSYIMGRITTPLLKLSITKLVIKVNKNDINYGRVHSPENRGDLLESCLHVHVVQFYFRPPNLGNIGLPYTLGQGRCDFPYNVKNF